MLSRELQCTKKEWKGGFAISKKLKHLEKKIFGMLCLQNESTKRRQKQVVPHDPEDYQISSMKMMTSRVPKKHHEQAKVSIP